MSVLNLIVKNMLSLISHTWTNNPLCYKINIKVNDISNNLTNLGEPYDDAEDVKNHGIII